MEKNTNDGSQYGSNIRKTSTKMDSVTSNQKARTCQKSPTSELRNTPTPDRSRTTGKNPNMLITEFVRPQNREPVIDYRPVANHDYIEEYGPGYHIRPEQNGVGRQSQTFDSFTFKRCRIVSTTDRTQIFLWVFIWITRFLFILTFISFLISLFLLFKNLLDYPNRIVNWTMHILYRVSQNKPILDDDTFWNHGLRGSKSYRNHKPCLKVTDLVADPARIMHEVFFPLLSNNPVIWLIIMSIFFICYHLLSFIHESLLQVRRVMGTPARRFQA